MKILFLGDIVGKPGRKAVAEILPQWKKEYEPDFVIANAENIAHGTGVTSQTIEEARQAGIDFFTTGDHWADKSEGMVLFEDKDMPIIRPANWPGDVAGSGYKVIEVGATQVAIINLLGQVFIKKKTSSPFHVLDQVLGELPKSVKIKIIDFQAEATSEKMALAWYIDGKVSAVLGTHTHVATADATILPSKTAFVSDVGMCGAVDSVIGVEKEGIIAEFKDQISRKHEISDGGEVRVNAMLMEIDNKSGNAKSIERLDTILKV